MTPAPIPVTHMRRVMLACACLLASSAEAGSAASASTVHASADGPALEECDDPGSAKVRAYNPFSGETVEALPTRPHPQLKGHDIVMDASGLQFTHPLPTDDELNHIYSVTYNAKYKRNLDEGAPLPLFVSRRADAQLKFIKQHLPSGAVFPRKVVEIGGGWGALASAILVDKPETTVTVFELDPKAVTYMRSRGVDAHVGHVGAFPDEQDRPEMFMLSHVLEHLSRPLDELTRCHAQLTPGGFLFMEIPMENPVPNWWGTDPDDPYFVGHLTFFTMAHVQQLVKAAGFEPIAAFHFNHPAAAGLVMPGDPAYVVEDVPVAEDTREVKEGTVPRFLRILCRKV